MSNVFTLQEVVEKQGLGPEARAFCEALLRDDEILAGALNYLPETVLWLVTTPLQAHLMRDTQPSAAIFTLGEAVDLAMSLGDPPPTSLWQVAVDFSAPAPSSPEDPPESPEDAYDADDPWD
jgi:hypothetical protein